ncbi:MAG: right-handed parallel beta-helix repeat-containing protein [Euryarchaeota archaeon]|nr:right-handed parallel beta-helix repeat-containing protein [Euryarchaeota archaeon]
MGRGLTNGSGCTNGLNNGVGRTNGLTNGCGQTNGLNAGFTNGGLTNGLGQTNGLACQHRFNMLGMQPTIRKRFAAFLIALFVIGLVGSYLILLPPSPAPKLVDIDGSFGDWSAKVVYDDPTAISDAPLDVSRFSIATEKDNVYGYVQARGDLLSRDSVDRYMAFIDSDNSASTGYSVGGIGADYVIEAYGWHDSSWTVQASRFSSTDQHNWSAFKTIGSGSAKSSGNEMEFASNIGAVLQAGKFRARFATASENASGELCAPIVDGLSGALVVTQTPQDNTGIVSTSNLLTLTLRAFGKDVTVNGIQISSAGVGSTSISGFSSGMHVPVGTPATLAVTGDVASLAAGTLVKASVASVSANVPYSIAGLGLAAYASSAPSVISIDGAFADWDSVQKSSDTAGGVSNPNIDITEHAAAAMQGNLYAYVAFNGAGRAFGGMLSPVARTRAVSGPSGNGTPNPNITMVLPRVTGEDVTRIYIDSEAGGQPIGGIHADYCIEIKGFGGKITSKRLYGLPARNYLGDAQSAIGAHQLETGVPFNLIGNPAGSVSIYIETTDWDKRTDASDSIFTVNASVSSTRAAQQARPAGGSGPDYPYPGAGDWVIAGDTSVWGETITVNGNLIISNTGSLTLSNCVLNMNSASDGQYTINVNAAGEFYVYDSTITPSNTAYKYRFEVYGRLWTNNSIVQYMWGDENAAPYIGGIQIYGEPSDVWLNSTLVAFSGGNGIHAVGAVGLNITGNSNITGNTRIEVYVENSQYLNFTSTNITDYVDAMIGEGIKILNSGNITIDNCIISHHEAIGLYMVNATYTTVQNCGIGVGASNTQNKVDGVVLDNCFSTVRITGNTIAYNGNDGIAFWTKSAPIIENNIIKNNSGSGIVNGGVASFYSEFYIYNNTIQNNSGAGIYVRSSNATIVNNKIENNSAGISLQTNSNATIINNTLWADNIQMYSSYALIANCYIRGSDAIFCNASSPFTVNTTIVAGSNGRAFNLENNSHPFTLNCTVDYWSHDYIKDTSNLTVQNYLHVRVLDLDGITPIPSAWINVTDNGALIYSGQTDTNGEIQWIIVTNRTYLNDYWSIVHPFTNISYNTTVVTADKGTLVFNNNPRIVPMDTSHWEIFQVASPIYITGDWIVDTVENHTDQTIYCSGRLIVTPTGYLTLNNVTVYVRDAMVNQSGFMQVWNSRNTIISDNVWISGTLYLNNSIWEINCSSDGQYKIQVNTTGEFYVYDSTITPYDTNYKYRFEVYGRLWANNSTVQYIWGDEFAAPYVGGIQIYGEPSDVWLNSTLVAFSGGNGIHAVGAVGLNITGNSNVTGNTRVEVYIENSQYLNFTYSNFTDYVDAQIGEGLMMVNSSNVVIDNCIISHHEGIGLYLINATNTVVQYCGVGVGASTTQNKVDGVVVDNCFSTVRFFGNTIAFNNGAGIDFFTKSAPIIENNLIKNNSGVGILNNAIESWYSEFYIYNNTIQNNSGAGIYIRSSNATIINNTLWADNIEMYNSYARVEDCFIRTGGAFTLNASSPLVINTTIIVSTSLTAFNIENDSHPIALNCTVDYWYKENIRDTSNLTVQNYLHVRAVDSDGFTPISNAWVNVTDNGVLIYSGQTDANGEIRWIIVTNRTYLQDYWTIFHPFANISYNVSVVTVEKGTLIFNNDPRTIPMDTSHWEIFQVPEFDSPLIAVFSMLIISILAVGRKRPQKSARNEIIL